MRYRFVVLALLVGACGSAIDPSGADLSAPDASNNISITTTKTTYTWDEASFGGDGIVATIRNTSARDFYANVGDGFNGALDQPTVYIALGTDAAVERQQGDGSWSVLPTGVLIEGSRVVVLKAGRTYTLRGNLSEPRQVGTMRIRLNYFVTTNPAGVKGEVDYSPTFVVR